MFMQNLRHLTMERMIVHTNLIKTGLVFSRMAQHLTLGLAGVLPVSLPLQIPILRLKSDLLFSEPSKLDFTPEELKLNIEFKITEPTEKNIGFKGNAIEPMEAGDFAPPLELPSGNPLGKRPAGLQVPGWSNPKIEVAAFEAFEGDG